MQPRRSKIFWIALACAMCLMLVVGIVAVSRLRFAETEVELRQWLSDEDVSKLVAWGRQVALDPQSSTARWTEAELPDHLRRIDAKWAATSEFYGHKYLFIHFQGERGKSGLLVADPAAKWPDPAPDWSQWSPGLWYHRE
jgi:hypothetical protein